MSNQTPSPRPGKYIDSPRHPSSPIEVPRELDKSNICDLPSFPWNVQPPSSNEEDKSQGQPETIDNEEKDTLSSSEDDEESSESDSSDDSESDSDDSDDSDDSSDESDDEEEEDPVPQVSPITNKKLGRIRPVYNKGNIVRPAAQTKPGLKINLPGTNTPLSLKDNRNLKNGSTGLGLSLPLASLASRSQRDHPSGSPPLTPVPVNYSGVPELKVDLEELIADRFAREQFQYKFEHKNPEILQFLSLPETLRTLIHFVLRQFEPIHVNNCDQALKKMIKDSHANFALFYLSSTIVTRLQNTLLKTHDLLDLLFSALTKEGNAEPTSEVCKLISQLATQKAGDEMFKYFQARSRKDPKFCTISLFAGNLANPYVVNCIIDMLASETPRVKWADYFAASPFDFPTALIKRFTALAATPISEFDYSLLVETQHIGDIFASIQDKSSSSAIGKILNSTPWISKELVHIIHSGRLTFDATQQLHPTLQVAISMLGHIARLNVNSQRYTELCPPVLEPLLPHDGMSLIVDLMAFLSDPENGEESHKKFGLLRPNAVDLIERLFGTGYSRIHEYLFESGVFSKVFELILSRRNNTILHQRAALVFKDLFLCNSKDLLLKWLCDFSLVEKIVALWDKYSEAQQNSTSLNQVSYYPHIFSITKSLEMASKMVPRYQQLADYLSSHLQWQSLVNGSTYKSYDEMLKRKLMKEFGAVYIRKKVNIRR